MGGGDCGPEKGLTRCGDRGAFLQFRLRLFNHNVFQLVEMLNCYRKHIEADGGSQNYRGQGKPHVPLPKIRGPRTMVTPAPNETQAPMFGSRQRSWPDMKTVVAGCELRIFTLRLCCITTVPVRLGRGTMASNADEFRATNAIFAAVGKRWKAADRKHQTGTITRRSWKPRDIEHGGQRLNAGCAPAPASSHAWSAHPSVRRGF